MWAITFGSEQGACLHQQHACGQHEKSQFVPVNFLHCKKMIYF